MKRLTIVLRDDEYAVLKRLAEEEHHTLRIEAQLIIRRELERLDFLNALKITLAHLGQ